MTTFQVTNPRDLYHQTLIQLGFPLPVYELTDGQFSVDDAEYAANERHFLHAILSGRIVRVVGE